jgi:hypothetical protein
LFLLVSSVTEEFKINAAQASHLSRIARERRACRFTALGGKVCARETAFPEEYTFLAHAADAVCEIQIRDSRSEEGDSKIPIRDCHLQ